MTIYELADILNIDIEITRHHGQGHRHTAWLRGVEVKDGGLLAGTCGDSDSADEAVNAYARKLAGQTIVINAGTEDRREVLVPASLVGGAE